jgi:hypothetical protein
MKILSASDVFLGLTVASTTLLVGVNAFALFLLR